MRRGGAEAAWVRQELREGDEVCSGGADAAWARRELHSVMEAAMTKREAAERAACLWRGDELLLGGGRLPARLTPAKKDRGARMLRGFVDWGGL